MVRLGLVVSKEEFQSAQKHSESLMTSLLSNGIQVFRQKRRGHIHDGLTLPSSRWSTLRICLAVFASCKEGKQVIGCTSQGRKMAHLMRVAPDVERARTQAFGKSTSKQAHAQQQSQGFCKVPLSSNLPTCFMPTQRASALENG